MEFRVGQVRALCTECGASQFKPYVPENGSGPRTSFTCVVCETRTTYAELIKQIGRERTRQRAKPKIAPAPRPRVSFDTRPDASWVANLCAPK